MATELFDNIAQRLYGENNLSDITWAFCQTYPTFKRLFITFFFKDIDENAPYVDIERERPSGSSRVDFFFNHAGENYIIENKIDDKSQHFGQYDTTYNVTPQHFGYIINYDDFWWKGLSRKEYADKGYQIRTWEEFYDYLEEARSNKEISKEEQNAISQYQTYVKNVCSIIKIKKPMRLSALGALPAFFQILDKKALQINREDFQTKVYINGQKTKFGGNFISYHPEDCAFGRFFSVTFPAFKRYKENWGWLGIYCHIDSAPTICIGFDDNKSWGRPIYRLIQPTINDDNSAWYEESGMLWTDMNEEEFRQLNEAESIEKQIELIQNFVIRAMGNILKLYNDSIH